MSSNGKIILQTQYSDLPRVHAVGNGRWNPTEKTWSWPATPAFYKRIKQQFPDVQNPRLETLLTARTDARRLAQAGGPPDYPHKTTPWHHQVGATRFAIRMDAALLQCHMGAGKTKVAIDTIRSREHKISLVLCPLSVVRVWQDEAAKHAPADWRIVALEKGSTKKRAAQLQAALDDPRQVKPPLVAVLNYDAARMGDLAKTILSQEWDCLVLDESARIKAPGGKTSRFCAKITASHKLALTGTPLPHSPLDAYGQYRTLDPGVFGTSFLRFRDRYAVMQTYPFPSIRGWKNLDEFTARLDELRWIVPKDALDLPPLMDETRRCTLEPAAAKLYREMENLLITEVHSGTVTASNAMVKLLRLQQITGGHLTPEGADRPDRVSRAKATLLADLVEDFDAPCIVFCRFVADLAVAREALAARYGAEHVGEISGRIKDYNRWCDGDCNALAVQVQAGGLGIDLSRAPYGIFYSLGYSLGDYEQAVARLHRPGATNRTVIYHLLATDTVDEKVMAALARRRAVVEQILEGYADER